jgi:PIN domain nuclease of toxin-antitoxin system
LSVDGGIVLDSSVLVAALLKERGGEVLDGILAGDAPVMMSSVNLAETIAVLVRRRGVDADAMRAQLLKMSIAVVPFGVGDTARTAALHAAHRGVLSLGDAACVATAEALGLPVLTADRAWTTLGLPLDIRLSR